MSQPTEPFWLAGGMLLILILSGIDPVVDRYTWFLETFPVMIGLALLTLTWRRYPLTLRLCRLHDRQFERLGAG
ncbi:MAG: hypothetical protein P8166_16165 [Candidatus Thiodiazotropha sp.]